MNDLKIMQISSEADMESAFKIRRLVFCEEQKVDEKEEFDGLDNQCRQYLVKRAENAIATARIRNKDHKLIKIERVAVLKENRGKGIGQELMKWIIRDVKLGGGETLALHSQCHAQSFYEGLGFKKIGNTFEEAGIPHVYMEFYSTS